MSNVIQFPSKAAKGMAYLEHGIRSLMESKGESEEVIILTIKTLKEVYKKYGNLGKQHFQLKLPPYLSKDHINAITQQISNGVQMLNQEHAKIINQLAAELALTKVQLYQYQTDNTHSDIN